MSDYCYVINTTTMLIKFEEEFDKEFSLCSSAVDCEGDFRPLDISLPVIKQFITSLLQKQEEETRREIEEEVNKLFQLVHERDWDMANVDEAYNNALKDVIKILKK